MKRDFEKLRILDNAEKKKIINRLNEQFGVDSIPGKLAMRGRERLFIYTGNFGEDEIEKIESGIFVERVGIYFAKIEESGIRPSIEGTQILKDQIKKNFIEISEELAEQWMMGHELSIKSGMKGFVAIKYKNEFLGTGKASEEKIGNFIPKNRRLREKS